MSLPTALSSSSIALFGIAFSPSSLITLFSLSGLRIFSDKSGGSSRGRAEEMSTTISGTYRTVDRTSTATSGTNETVVVGTDDTHGIGDCERKTSFSPTTLPLLILNFSTLEK
ncbi:hypothetical protein Fot_22039 [Forsythia ovata]|uniref:Secreted protein n=1 Tax=Forsythia ovata TaxID=205694 RepID=A0ABD1UWK7_9LAMI